MLKTIASCCSFVRGRTKIAALAFLSVACAQAAHAQVDLVIDDFQSGFDGQNIQGTSRYFSSPIPRWYYSTAHAPDASGGHIAIDESDWVNQYLLFDGSANTWSLTWIDIDSGQPLTLDPASPFRIEFDYLNVTGAQEMGSLVLSYLLDNRWTNMGAGNTVYPVGYRLHLRILDDTTIRYELVHKADDFITIPETLVELEVEPGLLSPAENVPGRPIRVAIEVFQNKQKLFIDGVEQFDLDIDPLPQNILYGNTSYVQLWASINQPRGIDNIKIQVLEAPEPEPWSPIVPGEIYWANTTMVRTSESDGGDPRTMLDEFGRLIGVAVDGINEKIYWTDGDAGNVHVSDLSGDNHDIIYSGSGSTQGIAVNPDIGKIFWAEYSGGLFIADLDGSNMDQILANADYGITSGSAGVTIDPLTGEVYWVEVSTGTLVRLQPDGSGAETVGTLAANAYGIAVDSERERVYYTIFGANSTLNSFDLNTLESTTVLEGLDQPLGVALTADGNGLFWTERTGGEIHRVHIYENGTFGPPERIRIGENSPFYIALTPEAVGPIPPPAKRGLFAYEGFDYGSGSLVGQNGGSGWAGAWEESNETNAPYPHAQVVSGGLAFGDLIVTGNKGLASAEGRAFRSIDTSEINPEQLNDAGNLGIPGTSLWASFLVEGRTDVPTDGFWGLSFFRDASETLFFGKSATSNVLRLSGQGQTAQEFDGALAPMEQHFIVLRFDFSEDGDDVVTLFDELDPMGRIPSDEDALGTFSAPDFSFNRIRLANNGGPGGTIDEIRVGARWLDVTPVPFYGFVNGNFEDSPYDLGWTVNLGGASEHPGIVSGSNRAVFIPNDGATRLVQYLPQWTPLIPGSAPSVSVVHDPITGEHRSEYFQSIGPKWQLGFHTAVADPDGAGNRSLNLLLAHVPAADYDHANIPTINFRINGTGGADAFNNATWVNVVPAGTFEPSEVVDGEFVDPIVYYVQLDGDYSTETPSFTVSVRRSNETEFIWVSDPISAWQYADPTPGSGIAMVHFHGFVQAPYVIDEIHLVAVGGSEGYTTWAETYFNSSELADPSVSGATADPDGDGIANWLEYAFGGNPRVADRSILPVQDVTEIEGELYLTLSFTRPAAMSELEYRVEASGDLDGWSNDPVEVGSVDNGNGTITETYRDSEPIDESAHRFMRVNVLTAPMVD